MPEIVVQKRHREAAWKAVCGKAEPSARVLQWFDGDRVTYQPESTFGAVVSVAYALAEAQASERADTIAAANDCARLFHAEEAHDDAETLEAFVMLLEAGRHVGAAKRGDGR